MTDLPRSAQRVQEAAAAMNLEIAVTEMPKSTRTAPEAAAACGCQLAQIVKSLIFRGADTGTPYLFLVSGSNRVDEAKVAAHIGETLERPDANFVREVTGFAIGGVPPFGHASDMAVYIDEELLQHQRIWAAAGTPKCLFSVEPKALCRATSPQVIAVK